MVILHKAPISYSACQTHDLNNYLTPPPPTLVFISSQSPSMKPRCFFPGSIPLKDGKGLTVSSARRSVPPVPLPPPPPRARETVIPTAKKKKKKSLAPVPAFCPPRTALAAKGASPSRRGSRGGRRRRCGAKTRGSLASSVS